MNPTVTGRVVVELFIAAQGAVVSAHVLNDTTGSAALRECTRAMVQRLEFPESSPPARPTTARVTFAYTTR